MEKINTKRAFELLEKYKCNLFAQDRIFVLKKNTR